jgi:tetratricopeptide (TPR) repeat protein
VVHHVTLSRYLVVFALVSAGCGAHRGGAASVKSPSSNVPKGSGFAATLESSDERLKAALLLVSLTPTAQAHRQVALEYRRLRVLDHAQEHFAAALKLDPKDAVSRDGVARIWRDWGFPTMALPEARRAVADAPDSAAAANTLGTVFQALGKFDDAKRWYWRAVAIDAGAWYALNNLCYAEIMTRQPYAIAMCERAVTAAPDSSVARNNMALAHAASGDLDGAKTWFRRATNTATADYNYGIVMMSERKYRDAQEAFRLALLADPDSVLAARRARQARLAADAEEHNGDHH